MNETHQLKKQISASPIRVQVLFFGATADAVGEREIELEFGEITRAEEAFNKIRDEFPDLQKNFNQNLLFAVNQEYAKGDEIIQNGDELAVFTAVSGG